ncbi:MAG: short-chain fatty acid transporter [Deltaproteobacteria bacterium]|nr:short-chain fatty acid transporter [Deltaproteobacteria bacterium]
MRALGRALSRAAGRVVPDPFAIAILLTFVSLGLAWAFGDRSPLDLVGLWGGRLDGDALLPSEVGLWRLLTFAMQMCLILVTGHALASSPPMERLIARLAALPRSAAQAVALTALVAMLAALVNWGLGLIVGALAARSVAVAARGRGLRVHYPLLGAAGYAGLMVWHGGLSGSAPLTVTQSKDLASLLGRPDVAPIPLQDTLTSPLNLCVTALLLIVVPLVLTRMLPRDGREIIEVDPRSLPGVRSAADAPDPRAERHVLDDAWWLAAGLAGLAIAYLVLYLRRIGLGRIDLNAVNLAFLALGLLLHRSPAAYLRAITDATTGCAGIILQFPLYAGIMGVFVHSGLIDRLATSIATVADGSTFAPLTMLSAGAVNLFVPSGGGQWAIQGPLVVQSAERLGVPLGKAVMAFAYGDEWTNMLQPFWALPLLAITGLRARDLIGYTAAVMLLALPVYLGCLWAC